MAQTASGPATRVPALLAVLAIAGAASAESTETSTNAWPIAVQPWLFNQDSRVPGAMQVISSSRLAFSAAGGEGWPVARLPLSTGAAFETVTELGLGGSVSLQLSGLRGDEAVDASGARLGMRWAPIAWRSTRVAVSGGLVQQLTRTGGAWAAFALEQSIGIVRLATSVQAERSFTAASDPVDVRFAAGADVAIGNGLRAGVEYAARELEETVSRGNDGGANQMFGAVVGARTLGDRLALSLGPGLALGGTGIRPVGRVAMLWSF
jgi:hypothetical protein